LKIFSSNQVVQVAMILSLKKFLCYLKAVPFFYFDPKLTKN